MPRRMPKSHEELRLDAIVAARTMVEADGFSSVTVRRVADRIGCSIGSIYNLFRDLDDLIIHVCAGTIDTAYDVMSAPGLPDEPHARVHAMGRRYHDFVLANQNLWFMLFEHRAHDGRDLPPWYAERLGKLLAFVHANVAPALEKVPVENRVDAVNTLWAGVHGIVTLGAQGKLGIVTAASAADCVRLMIDMVLAGHDQPHLSYGGNGFGRA